MCLEGLTFAWLTRHLGRRAHYWKRKATLNGFDLNFTGNRSYENVVEGIKSGGQFQGWRLATLPELRAFFARFTGTTDGHS